MPKVLFILEIPTPQRTPVLNELSKRGVNLLAAYFAPADHSRGWGDVPVNHPSVTIPSGRIRSAAFAVRKVRESDVEVLCCFGYNRLGNVAAVLTARWRGIKVVTRSDSNYQYELTRPLLKRTAKRIFLRLLYGRRTRVWTVGTQNDRFWASMGMKERHLIPYGTPQPPVGSRQEGLQIRSDLNLGDGTVFLSVGRLEPWKGTDVLLDAFKSFRQPNAKLLLVGKGSLEPAVHRAMKDDERIHYLGVKAQQELGPIYACSDALVVPSRQEAWGLVVDEALSNGVRVIASDAVGCAVDLIHENNGWIFRSEDVADLAEKLREANDAKARGWPLLGAAKGYNAAPAMLADLSHLASVDRVVA